MQHLDAISLGVFSYLEAHERVSRIEAAPFVKASPLELKIWEQKNLPYKFPEDMTHFYSIVNGLSVKWFVLFRGTPILVGHFSLNSLQNLKRIIVTDFTMHCRALDQHRVDLNTLAFKEVVGFILETSQYGTVVLLYLKERPQIWFQDSRGQWSFLAETFSNYYRMMLTHLSIISWQTIFTDMGVDPLQKPWLYLFIPTRMLLNEDACDKKTVTSNTMDND